MMVKCALSLEQDLDVNFAKNSKKIKDECPKEKKSSQRSDKADGLCTKQDRSHKTYYLVLRTCAVLKWMK